MAISNIDPKESDWAREHIRYVSGMRGSFTAGQESRQEEIDAISTKLSAVTEERDAITEELNTVTEKLDTVTEELNTVTEERDALSKKLDSLDKELAASKVRIKELESRNTVSDTT